MLLLGKEGKEDGKEGKEEQDEHGEEGRARSTLERQERVETKVVSRVTGPRRVGRVRGRIRTLWNSRVTVLTAICGDTRSGTALRGRKIGLEGKVELMHWKGQRSRHT